MSIDPLNYWQPMDKFSIQIEQGDNGLWYATSLDIKGLFIAEDKPTALFREIPKAMAQLEEAQRIENWGKGTTEADELRVLANSYDVHDDKLNYRGPRGDQEDLRRIADEIERLRALINGLGLHHVCGGEIKPGRESCTRCGAEEDAAAMRSVNRTNDPQAEK